MQSRYVKVGCLSAAVMLSLASISSATQLAEGTKYGGVQFSMLDYDISDVFDSFEPTAVVGRMGLFVKDNVALEGRIGKGLSDDKQYYFDSNIEGEDSIGLGSLFGVFVVAHLPLENTGSLYGVLGLSRVKTSVKEDYYIETWLGSELHIVDSYSVSDTGLSYGFGFNWHMQDNIALNIEYMMYVNESDYSVAALNMGVTYNF